jgi:hypothetical protein
VDCHEKWSYTYDKGEPVQKLLGMIALCPACHQVKHFGLACKMGKEKQALKHLAKVNNWSTHVAEVYVEAMFALAEERNRVKWILDLSGLEQYGVKPPSRTQDRWGVKVEQDVMSFGSLLFASPGPQKPLPAGVPRTAYPKRPRKTRRPRR